MNINTSPDSNLKEAAAEWSASLSKRDKRDLFKIGEAFIAGSIAEDLCTGEISLKDNLGLDLPKIIGRFRRKMGNKITCRMGLDYTDSLLSQARMFVRVEKFEFGCLFYAIWLEHRINDYIRTISLKESCSQRRAPSTYPDSFI